MKSTVRPAIALAALLLAGAPVQAADEQCQQIRSRYAAGRQHAVAENEMAFCAAREGRVDEAFKHLDQALAKGLHSYHLVSTDDDFRPLHADARWAPRMELLASAEARHLASINRELQALYEADQSDRRQQPIDWGVVAPRDAQRRARVLVLATQGHLKTADDHYHAAMVMQHGETPEDFERAMQWSRQAWRLDADHESARWLSAAAEDRWLHSQGKPQIWGTQFRRPGGEGPWTQEPFDRSARTDAERQAMGVPPMAQNQQRLERMNAQLKP